MVFFLLFFSLQPLLLSATNLFFERLQLPDQFKIEVYLDNIPFVTSLKRGINGVIFAGTSVPSEYSSASSISAILDLNQDAIVDKVINVSVNTVSDGMGFAIFNDALYVASLDKIYKYENIYTYLFNDRLPMAPTCILDNISLPSDTYHGSRYLVADNKRLYISVNSPCNIPYDNVTDLNNNCLDGNPFYGTIYSFTEKNCSVVLENENIPLAIGIRESLGMTLHPYSEGLWFTDNGRENWLPDPDYKPLDELNYVFRDPFDIGNGTRKHHYGFPYCYGRDTPDPTFNVNGSCRNYTPAVLELTSHGVTRGLRFYPDQTPPNPSFVSPYFDNATVFPLQYQTLLFITQSGSVSAQPPRGAQIVTGSIDEATGIDWAPFLTGFVWNPPINCTDDSQCPGTSVCQNQNTSTFFPVEPFYCSPWGAPSDVEVMLDGSILVADSQNGVIYRIFYSQDSSDTPWYKEPGAIVIMIVEGLLGLICLIILIKVYPIIHTPSPEAQYGYMGINNSQPPQNNNNQRIYQGRPLGSS